MPLKVVRRIELPAHPPEGGFDHAAVDVGHDRLYVAHPSNDSVEVIDLAARKFVRSLPGHKGVAGVWVSEERSLLFATNRGMDTASVLRLPEARVLFQLPTGARPNGIAFDSGRQVLAVAGVGNSKEGLPPTLTTFDVVGGEQLHRIVLPGRTRWVSYLPRTDSFFVNIADPPGIAEVPSADPSSVRRIIAVPGVGPHGLEKDPEGDALYCACDGGQLVRIDLPSGRAKVEASLPGPPDVLWLNPNLGHLYAAIGEPGVVQVFKTRPLSLLETLSTGPEAHTLTVDPKRNEVHVFLPRSHEDLVLGG